MELQKESKRVREVNWTAGEKACLRQCVDPHISIIDDKGNDAAIIAKKRKVWQRVKMKMLAAGYDRDIDKLRQQWVRMKLAARKSFSAERKTDIAIGSMTEVSSVHSEDMLFQGMISPELDDEIERQKEAKRYREVNWSVEEKTLLRKCIDSYISIIEDKANDAATIAKKRKVWDQVKMTMLTAGYDRDVGRLRQQWTRMKLAARRSRKTATADGDMSDVSSVYSEDMLIQSMMAPELEEDPILLDRNVAEESQREVKNESSNSDQLYLLQVELLRAQIQHQRSVENNEKDMHALRMQNERELHSLKVELLRRQINGQKRISSQQEKSTMEKVEFSSFIQM